MDIISGAYRGGNYIHHLSRKTIETMKKNMKKIPIIATKAEKYHRKEQEEAEKLLLKLSTKNI